MKKFSTVLVILIILNFIFAEYIVYADPTDTDATATDSQTGTNADEDNEEAESSSQNSGTGMTMEKYKLMQDEGKVEVGGTTQDIGLKESDSGSAGSFFGGILVKIGSFFARNMADFTNAGGYYNTDSEYSAEKTGVFTINSLLFNEYMLFNSKPYQLSTDLNPNVSTPDSLSTIDALKQRGIQISGFLTRVCLILAIPMLFYSITKAIAANQARDVAAWKKILVRWVISILLLFLFQYVFIAIDSLSDAFTNSLWNMRIGLEDKGYPSFESTMLIDALKNANNTGGIISFAYGIVFVSLVVLEFLFLVKYALRSLGILLLFIIAPVIIIVNAFKLMLGRDSGMLGDMFKTYMSFEFIQPLNALFYVILIFSFSEIVIRVPVLGIVLLYALYRSEQVIKAMFGWELGTSILTRK